MSKVTYKCIDCGKERTSTPSKFSKLKEEYRCQSCAAKNRLTHNIMVTYKCTGCGKEYTNHINYFKNKNVSQENYRCIDCARKFRFANHISKKVTYKCIDCGKERTAYKHAFDTIEENYRCSKCAAKTRKKRSITKRVTYTCIDCGKQRTAYLSMFRHPPEEYRCKKCANKFKTANHRNNKVTYSCVDCGKERTTRPCNFNGKTRENYRCPKCAHKKMIEDPVWKENSKIANQRMAKDPVCKENKKKAALKRVKDPVWIDHHRRACKDSPSWVENILIDRTGEGIWYGNSALRNANNNGRTYYCEKWNPDLKRRIDAAYDYESIMSGRTRFDNDDVSLTHHHLYWQKKACCIWDEDVAGYYAWILNNKEWVKYYIKGDPNKFVLLTEEEHGIIKGKNGTTKDRIYYIKLLENLVEERMKEGKKCYLTPEEYEVYKVEHKDIIEKYKK